MSSRVSTSPVSRRSPKMLTKEPNARSVQAGYAARTLLSTKSRFWIEIIALVSGLAFAFALMIATVGAVAGAAAEDSEPGQSGPSPITRTYEGMVTDTHCGAKHSAALGGTAASCTLACVRGGEQFVLVDGDTTYFLEGDGMALKR